MPGIELHADFDRDGRLTRSAVERAARLSWPGAVVVANLDRDQRVLPGSVSSGATPGADYDLATAFARDDELLPTRRPPLARCPARRRPHQARAGSARGRL